MEDHALATDRTHLAVVLAVLANDLMALVPDVLANRVNQTQRHRLANTLDTLAGQLRHHELSHPRQRVGA